MRRVQEPDHRSSPLRGGQRRIAAAVAPNTGPQVAVGSHTDQGGRRRNEDYAACYVGAPSQQPAIDCIAVLFGMGGAKGGRVAAEDAVRGFMEGCIGRPITPGVSQISAHALDSVNRGLHTLGRPDAELNEMACTLSALVLCGRRAHLLHVGHSRIYRLRDNQLTLLTTDHTSGAPARSSRSCSLDSGRRRHCRNTGRISPCARRSLYQRDPVRFWQIVCAILLLALLFALAR